MLCEGEKRKPARKRNKVSVLIKSESGRRTRKMERESDGVWREGLKMEHSAKVEEEEEGV